MFYTLFVVQFYYEVKSTTHRPRNLYLVFRPLVFFFSSKHFLLNNYHDTHPTNLANNKSSTRASSTEIGTGNPGSKLSTRTGKFDTQKCTQFLGFFLILSILGNRFFFGKLQIYNLLEICHRFANLKQVWGILTYNFWISYEFLLSATLR